MKTLLTYCISPAVYGRYHTAQSIQADLFLPKVDVFTHVSFGDGAKFNLARARNYCIDKAIRGGHDLLILCDADTVIESLTISDLLPDFGVAVATGFSTYDYQPCSWLALRRSVFTKFRYCEQFDSIFWQDIDFDQNVTGQLDKVALWYEFRCRHIPHPIATQVPEIQAKYVEGQALFEARRDRLRESGAL